MAFDHMFVVPNNSPPGRFFFHKSGREVYGGTDEQMNNAAQYVRDVLDVGRHMFGNYDFLLGSVWGDSNGNGRGGDRVLDVFGFDFTGGDWKSANPEAHLYSVRNGIIHSDSPSTCADTLMLFGEELRAQRTSHGLQHYIGSPKVKVPGFFEDTASSSVLD